MELKNVNEKVRDEMWSKADNGLDSGLPLSCDFSRPDHIILVDVLHHTDRVRQMCEVFDEVKR